MVTHCFLVTQTLTSCIRLPNYWVNISIVLSRGPEGSPKDGGDDGTQSKTCISFECYHHKYKTCVKGMAGQM